MQKRELILVNVPTFIHAVACFPRLKIIALGVPIRRVLHRFDSAAPLLKDVAHRLGAVLNPLKILMRSPSHDAHPNQHDHARKQAQANW
jgi:hypothetical protein